MSEPVHVLWTGGWDSTFRVADLVLTHGVTVQPHYGRGTRISTRDELAAMDRIRDLIADIDGAAAARLLPSELHEVGTNSDHPDLEEHRRHLMERRFLGSQYVPLAALAARIDRPLELCIHRDDRAAAVVGDEIIHDAQARPSGTWRLSLDVDDQAVSALFSGFEFPLYDKTKLGMLREAEQRGFAGVLEATWFCHEPTSPGRPCGVCAPCQYTRDEGLAHRVPGPLHPAVVRRRARVLGGRAKRLAYRTMKRISIVR